MENYLETLNPEQKRAVLATEGPVLIIAGAGAGKTKTITSRVLHLIKNGVKPEKILAITFTNKAAREMLDRVGRLLADDKNLNLPVSQFSNPSVVSGKLSVVGYPWIGTFHSLGVKILRENFKVANISASFSSSALDISASKFLSEASFSAWHFAIFSDGSSCTFGAGFCGTRGATSGAVFDGLTLYKLNCGCCQFCFPYPSSITRSRKVFTV